MIVKDGIWWNGVHVWCHVWKLNKWTLCKIKHHSYSNIILWYVCQQAPCFKSKFITAELAYLFSQSDSEEEFEGFSSSDEEEDCKPLKSKVWNTISWKCVCEFATIAPTCMIFFSPGNGFRGGQWRRHRLLLGWWRASPNKEKKPFSGIKVCVCVCVWE